MGAFTDWDLRVQSNPAGAISSLLEVLDPFQETRLRRCGATDIQISAMKADWNTRDIQWQSQMGSYLNSLPDATIQSFLATWPPALPGSAWPYYQGLSFTDYADGSGALIGGPSGVITDNGDGSASLQTASLIYTDNSDGSVTLTLAN